MLYKGEISNEIYFPEMLDFQKPEILFASSLQKTPSMCGLNTTPGVGVVVVVAVAALGRCCWLRVVLSGSPVCRITYTVRSD